VYLATRVTRENPHGITTKVATGRHIQAGGSLLKALFIRCLEFIL